MTRKTKTDSELLSDIRFGFLYPYKVAGMGEPWVNYLDRIFLLLSNQNIKSILTLTEDNHFAYEYINAGFANMHIPIEDYCAPTKKATDAAVKFINDSLCLGGVAVHCAEGRGRTGTILAVWLGITESLQPECAIEKLYALRYHTALSPSQRLFIHEYLKKYPDK